MPLLYRTRPSNYGVNTHMAGLNSREKADILVGIRLTRAVHQLLIQPSAVMGLVRDRSSGRPPLLLAGTKVPPTKL